MNVLKFGGTSVGSAEPLQNVKKIVTSHKEGAIVVVSALGGITDKLIATAKMAGEGDVAYRGGFDQIRARHLELIEELGFTKSQKESLLDDLEMRFVKIRMLLDGVYTLGVLPRKTRKEIVSYGERLSSKIVAALIPDSEVFDSLAFIKTENKDGKDKLNTSLTNELVKKTFAKFTKTKKYAIVPGFISTDSESGDITNLGRGGSDYTASIIAAAIDADCLEIWTDVDGFMTADPRIIKTSYVIDELSFNDAMELCNFGAKVIYSPALYPVYKKDIPVLIKNTFNLKAKGTVIKKNTDANDKTITGIASIDDSCILTVSGPSMAGLVGVNSRIFNALAAKHISVFLVSQASSETNISLGINTADAELAREVLNKEFEDAIAVGAMDPIKLITGLATVAVVGENMKQNAGVAGKIFSVLGRNGISIIACAQGTEEDNISFVVDKKYLRKSLNVIHDSFLLSEYKELNLFICGIGTVGGSLIEQIASQREKLMKKANLKLNIVGISRSNKGIFDRNGIDLANYKELLAGGIDLNTDKLRDEVIGMNIFNSVFVDCTANEQVASLYKDFFEHGISVVAANKVAASSDYENYAMLKELALKRNVKFLFETNVGAGLPIINTINALVKSGDKVEKIEAVLSGTLNFIFNTISKDIPFSQTVRMAKEQGYSEPDPRIDLSEKDVVRKLVILSREAGYKVNQNEIDAKLFIPEDFFSCSIEEFWAKLPSLDAEFEKQRQRLEAEHKHWRVVAKMEKGKYSVSLREFNEDHPFFVLEGTNNIILLTTERYHEHPMLIQGYGAGASVTSAGVFADIISIANV